MEIDVRIDSQLGSETEGLIRKAVIDVLANHPLIDATVDQPSSITVLVTVGMEERTAIDHSEFPTSGVLRLHVDEFHYPLGSDELRGEPLFEANIAHPKLRQLLAHEFSHFVDARLTAAFKYMDSKRPSDPRIRTIHFHLWDSFIDGRLGESAPHTLNERKDEALNVSGIGPKAIDRAWEGEFRDYDSIVKLASDLAEA